MIGRWVGFLRAINTGTRRVRGDRLAELFEALGFTEVSSFQASGNVLFSADEPDVLEIERTLEAGLGYEVPTVLRSAQAVRDLANTMPFSDSELAATERRVQVILLRDRVPTETLGSALSDPPPGNLLRPHGGDVFWLPNTGISDSTLDLSGIERRLGPVTVRTLNTVQRVAARL